MESIGQLLAVLMLLESGGNPAAPPGDGGRSFGPYQIQRPYFQDALVQLRREHDPRADALTFPGAVVDPATARLIILAYWRRWCPVALAEGDLSTLARVHNGGGPRARADHPRHQQWLRATDGYWRRANALLGKTP